MSANAPSDGSRLRIGVVCYPTFGGSGIVATEVGSELARRGHEVHFVCSSEPGRFDRECGARLHRVEARGYPLFDGSPYTLALASKLVEVVRSERLDLLHVHYAVPHAASAYLARQILGPAAPRLVCTMHGTDTTLVGSDPTFHPITKFSIEQCDALTTPSRWLADETRARFDLGSRAIDVVPNFVDAALFRPRAPDEPRDLAALFPRAPGDGRARLLFHGSNFRALKRVPDVVRALASLRAGGRDVRLALLGDGPERPRVDRLVRDLDLADVVCFLGERLDFAALLRDADLFLLPSETESFGLAALEALASGVPVVASRVGGLPEVVLDEETGILVSPGEEGALAAAAARLLDDDALHWTMATAARRRAVEQFALGPSVNGYEAVYRRVMRGG